jgi:hypothetical protein
MRSYFLFFATLAFSSSVVADDVDNVYKLGEASKKMGVVNSYEVQGWGRKLDLHMGSNSPGDAKFLANVVCKTAKEKMIFSQSWEVRVFLIVGERPAAICKTK